MRSDATGAEGTMGESEQTASAAALPPLAMHDRYGPLLRSFFARYFNPIRFPQAAVERIRRLEREGTLVYLAPTANLLHFLYLNYVCVRHGLPMARYVNGVDPVLVQPVSLLWERLHKLGAAEAAELDGTAEELEQHEMVERLRAGDSALLFLDEPTTITNPRVEHNGHGHRLLQSLIQLQQTSDRPLFLVPHLIKWNVHPERQDKGVTDAIFGQAEAPGLLRTLLLMLRHYRQAMVKVAEPIDLRQFLAQRHEHRPPILAGALEQAVAQRMELEVFDVAGPRIRPHEEFRAEVLADARIQAVIDEQAGSDEAERENLSKKAFDLLDEIAAEPRIRWPLALNRVLNLFWSRMYEGFVVDEAGFERIRQAIRKAPVIFCPSHKSHVDYLVLSQLCLAHRVPLPHIAAGVNLSFWPMGPIFRHSGAFFLRRSFKGEALYPVVFRTYLRHVMQEGFPIEFFIEGTRSRTGKLLSPRYGILSWLVQAFLEGTGGDVQFVPLSIDYEKLVESRSYVRELSGGAKRKEDVAGLLKARKALRTRYGKIYVQVGEIISARDVLAERGLTPDGLDEEQRRLLVQDLAHRILFRINRVATVTPSALVAFCLLNHRRRGMTRTTLLERARWLLDWVSQRGARLSATLDDFERALAEAISRFSRDGAITIRDTGDELVYSVTEDQRLALDYYRNNLLHYFVTAAITATALESFTVEAVPIEALSERIRDLSQLFKHEFLFRSQRHFEQELQQALTDLTDQEVLRHEDGFVVKTEPEDAPRNTFRAVLEHFLEAYWLTARGLTLLRDGELGERELLAKILQLGDRLYVRGELQYHESLSREIVKNALKAFADRDLIRRRSEPGKRGSFVALGPAAEPDAALEEAAAGIYAYLARG